MYTSDNIAAILERDRQERSSHGLSFDSCEVVSEETGQELPITGHKVCNHKLLAWHVINSEPELYEYANKNKDVAVWSHIFGVATVHPYQLGGK